MFILRYAEAPPRHIGNSTRRHWQVSSHADMHGANVLGTCHTMPGTPQRSKQEPKRSVELDRVPLGPSPGFQGSFCAHHRLCTAPSAFPGNKLHTDTRFGDLVSPSSDAKNENA